MFLDEREVNQRDVETVFVFWGDEDAQDIYYDGDDLVNHDLQEMFDSEGHRHIFD